MMGWVRLGQSPAHCLRGPLDWELLHIHIVDISQDWNAHCLLMVFALSKQSTYIDPKSILTETNSQRENLSSKQSTNIIRCHSYAQQ